MSYKLGSPGQRNRVDARKAAKKLLDEIDEKTESVDTLFGDIYEQTRELKCLAEFHLTPGEMWAAIELFQACNMYRYEFSEGIYAAGHKIEEKLQENREVEPDLIIDLTSELDEMPAPPEQIAWGEIRRGFGEVDGYITLTNNILKEADRAFDKIQEATRSIPSCDEQEMIKKLRNECVEAWDAIDAATLTRDTLRNKITAAEQTHQPGNAPREP